MIRSSEDRVDLVGLPTFLWQFPHYLQAAYGDKENRYRKHRSGSHGGSVKTGCSGHKVAKRHLGLTISL